LLKQPFEQSGIRPDRGSLTVEVDQKMPFTCRNNRFAKMRSRSLQRETVGHFQRSGKKTGAKYFLHRTGRRAKSVKARGETCSRGGSGSSRNVASVTTPSNPSDPTNNPIKSKPVLFLWVRPPVFRISPLASTTSRPMT
jgi:hypothetical protein